MLTALVLTLLTQASPPARVERAWRDEFGWRSWRNASAGYAFFEFAPTSGAGMGAACACAAITGAKGEAVTFTRAGDATCSKQGLATTGIADGDLVVCTANQPRVESSGGVLGLRVEGVRTNETLRSSAIENAVWATTVAGIAAPTITADFAVAPDGTTTADRVQIPACPAVGNASGINQTSATIASPSSSSVYLKANAGTPSVSICMYGITTGTRTCTQFALNTSTWTRAVVPDVTNTGGMNIEIACENRTASYTGATDTGAADILVWGAQSEAGAYATSYIPTVVVAVTRNAETATVALPVDRTETTICSAATLAPLWSTTGQVPAFGTVVGWAAPMLSLLSFPAGAARYFTSAGSVGAFQSGTQRLIGRDDNTNVTLAINGTTTSTAAGASVDRWTTTAGVGSAASGAAIDGIVSRIQLDPDPTRCSP